MVTTPEIVDKIHIVLANGQIKVDKIEEAVGISYERVHILHNELSQVLKNFLHSAEYRICSIRSKNVFEFKPQIEDV